VKSVRTELGIVVEGGSEASRALCRGDRCCRKGPLLSILGLIEGGKLRVNSGRGREGEDLLEYFVQFIVVPFISGR
jgi:hypothetical protein